MTYGDSEIVTRHDSPTMRREAMLNRLGDLTVRLTSIEQHVNQVKVEIMSIKRDLKREDLPAAVSPEPDPGCEHDWQLYGYEQSYVEASTQRAPVLVTTERWYCRRCRIVETRHRREP